MPGVRAVTHRHRGWLAGLSRDGTVYGLPPVDVGFTLTPVVKEA